MSDSSSLSCDGMISNQYYYNKNSKNKASGFYAIISISLLLVIAVQSISIALAQDATISGKIEASDLINNIGVVDLGLIENSLYNQAGIAIWQVTPGANYVYAGDLNFYAKLDKNDNRLSILLACEDQSKSLRGMIPSLKNFEAEETTLSSHPDPVHYCYPYNNKDKTLIYSILKDAFSDLKAKSVIGSNSQLNEDPIYRSSFAVCV